MADQAFDQPPQISLQEYLEEKIAAEQRLNEVFRQSAKEEFLTFKANLVKETIEAQSNVAAKMEVLNELRRAVETDRSLFVRVDKYDADMKARDESLVSLERLLAGRIDPIERWQAGIIAAELPAVVQSVVGRVKVMEDWRNKLVGLGFMLALFAGLVGALLMRLFSGVFGK